MSARALFELGLDFNDLFDEIYVLSFYFFIVFDPKIKEEAHGRGRRVLRRIR